MAVDLGVAPLDVVAGRAHTCVRLDGGAVLCWGKNTDGRLGTLSTVSALGGSPNDLNGFTPHVDLGANRSATALVAGGDFTCALLDDATVKCWGDGSLGQLGQGNTLDYGATGPGGGAMGDVLRPVALGANRTVLALTAATAHACALLDNRDIKCWGVNAYGALGSGKTSNAGADPASMGDALAAVQLGAGVTPAAVSAGTQHTCARASDGRVKCWGRGEFGALGTGLTVNRGDAATGMGDAMPIVALGTGRTAKQVLGGDNYTCALLDNAKVKCWGYDEAGAGQLGLGLVRPVGVTPSERGDMLPYVDIVP